MTLVLLVYGQGGSADANPLPTLEQGRFAKVYSSLQRNEGVFVGAVIDANGDEYQDLFIGQSAGLPDQLIIQHFNQPWEIVPLRKPHSAATRSALAVDVNNDYRQDLVVAREDAVHLYLNNGRELTYSGTLPDSENRPGETTVGLTAADVNADGWADVYAVRRGRGVNVQNRLWVNLAAMDDVSFREAAIGAGIADDGDAAGVFADLNDDGHPDLIVADRRGSPMLFVNDGVGNFEAMAPRLPIINDITGVNSIDADHDGDHDLLITAGPSHQGSGLRFFRNDGDFAFIEATIDAGLGDDDAVTSAVWLDVNNDGYRDLLHNGGAPGQVLVGGAKGFTHRQLGLPSADGRQAAWLVADFNRDGYSDVIAVSDRGEVNYWQWPRGHHHWLGVNLRGRDHRSPMGAKVVLKMADGTHFHHRLSVAYAPLNAAGPEMIFGLGRRSEVTMVEVFWPNGSYTRYDVPPINQHLGFVEPDQSKGGVDARIQHTVLGFVAARNRALKDNPGLRERLSRQEFVCR